MRNFFKRQISKRLETYTRQLIDTQQPQIIAVTGSVGKTSTKLAIAHILGAKRRVLVSESSYNTEIGLPLSLFELTAPAKINSVTAWLKIMRQMRRKITSGYPFDIVVLEMGADAPGNITRFMDYIRPDIGVVTAVAKVHMEGFETVEAIASEKWQLAKGSKTCIYNHDDERLRDRAVGLPGATGYGLSPADVWVELKQFNEDQGWSGDLHLDDATYPVDFPVLGQQSVYALTAAAAVAKLCGIDSDTITAQITSWQQPKGRMRLLEGKHDTRIIDDSYNSSPYAAIAALDTLYRFGGRKIAILGSMNELGEYEQAGHRLLGKHCQNLDLLVTIGLAANQHLVPAALAAGLDSSKVHECNTPYEAGDYVASFLKGGDTVLVKGSQNGVFAEEAIKPLLKNSQDEFYLVRQAPEWLAKKKEQFS